MRIMVYDVAAESGGAMTILKQYYEDFLSKNNNEYFFVISNQCLITQENVKVLSYPFVKKSWLHRLYFDYLLAPKLIKEYKIDRVFSLQNMRMPRVKVHQTVYFHNLLALTKEKFCFFLHPRLWIYKNVIGRLIRHSLKHADRIIVQAEWIKKQCIEELKVDSQIIEVEQPIISLLSGDGENRKSDVCTFFYPANGEYFKNHRQVVSACKLLKEQGIHDYKVCFTLEGTENKDIKKIQKIVCRENLPIEFLGYLSKERMIDMYLSSVLVFPSYIETIGLPLLEAKNFGMRILCADCQYAHAALEGYQGVEYFEHSTPIQIADLMTDCILKRRCAYEGRKE